MKDLSNNLYLFDCFGVVVSDVSRLWMEMHYTAEQQAIVRRDIYRKVDCGQISLRQSFDKIFQLFGSMDYDTAWAEWESVTWPMEQTVAVIEQIKQRGGSVALLSNAWAPYLEELFDRYDLAKHFDKIFPSSRYGCAKPDLQFYQLAVDSFNRKFNKIYFTDDNPANLIPAQQLGIIPVLFTSADQMAKDLEL